MHVWSLFTYRQPSFGRRCLDAAVLGAGARCKRIAFDGCGRTPSSGHRDIRFTSAERRGLGRRQAPRTGKRDRRTCGSPSASARILDRRLGHICVSRIFEDDRRGGRQRDQRYACSTRVGSGVRRRQGRFRGRMVRRAGTRRQHQYRQHRPREPQCQRQGRLSHRQRD